MSESESNKRYSFIEPLEPRILYSADAIAGTVDANLLEDCFVSQLNAVVATTEQLQTLNWDEDSENSLTEPDSDIQDPDDALSEAMYTASDDATANQRIEIVFVDTQTPDYQELLDDLLVASSQDIHFEVVIIDHDVDGLGLITETLSDYQNLDAIHIISHGNDGALQLGNTTLDAQSLSENNARITLWGDAFTDSGDILIYGCELAETAIGKTLIDDLGELTQTDVSASDDITGHEALGGDWELEYQTGTIETSVVISETAQSEWQSVLANTPPTITSNGGGPTSTINVAENTTAVTTVMASDVDTGDSMSYSIIVGDDGVLFNIDATSGELRFNAPPDYESPADADGDNVYVVTVQVDDGNSGTDTQTINVTVAAANESPTFAVGDGTTTTAVGSSLTSGEVVAIQSDGKILVAGQNDSGASSDIIIVRYNADGSLDTNFGTNGLVTTDLSGTDDRVLDIQVQSDGKIIVAGDTNNGLNKDFAVVRYNADGTLDTSFGGDGIVTTAIGSGNDTARTLSIQSDGLIVVAGFSHNGTDNDFTVVRYTTDGSLDTSFNGTGIVTTALGTSGDVAFDSVIQPDGKILIAGQAMIAGSIDFAIVRYNSNGTLDTTFNNDGIVTADFFGGSDRARGIALQSDGSIVVLGIVQNAGNTDIGLARYTATGALDSSFGSGGLQTTAVSAGSDFGYGVAIAADGNIIVSGSTFNGTDYDSVLLQYDASGTLDSTFGSGGILNVGSAEVDDEIYNVIAQSDGTIVFGGGIYNGTDYDFLLGKIDTSGQLDPTFDPVNTLDNNPTIDENGFVVLDPDVQILDLELDALNAGLGNYNGAVVTLVNTNGADSTDAFTFLDQNGISLNANQLIKNGQIIATFDLSTTPGVLVITFTDVNGEIPTSEDVDNILSQIVYYTTSDTPAASVQIDWDFNDGNLGVQGIGGAISVVGSTTVNITPVNDVPVATGNTVVATEDVPLIIGVSNFLFDDAEGNVLESVTITGLNINGGTLTHTGGTVTVTNGMVVTAAQLADLTFTSALNDSTNSSFTYSVNDSESGAVSAAMNITVNAVNDVSVATGNTVVATEDVPLVIGPGDFSFSDVEGDSLQSVTITGLDLNGGTLTHTGGTIVVTNGMTVTAAQLADLAFTSALNNSTNSSFTYTVNDAGSGVVSAMMNITVNTANDSPVITSNGGGASANITATENQGYVTTVTSTDADNGNSVYSITGGSDAQLFTIDPVSGVLTFSDVPDFENASDSDINGIYQVQVSADDGNGGIDVQSLSINVTDINEAPTLITVENSTLEEGIDTSSGYSLGLLSALDQDNADTEIYSIIGGTDADVFEIGGANADELTIVDGVLDFDQQSSYSVVIQVIDSEGLTHSETLTINVNQNLTPVFVSTAPSITTEDEVFSYTVVTDSVDGDFVVITATSLPDWLTLTDNGDGTATLSGIPDQNEVGLYDIELIVSDDVSSNIQSFTLEVINTPDSASAVEAVNIDPGPTTTEPESEPLEVVDEEESDVQEEVPAETEPDFLPTKPVAETVEPTLSALSGFDLMSIAGELIPEVGPEEFTSKVIDKNHTKAKFIDLAHLKLVPFAPSSNVTEEFISIMDNKTFENEMEEFEKELDEAFKERTKQGLKVSEITLGLTLSLTAGFVTWILKSGSLLASFVSVIPMWKQFDPLPILTSTARKNTDADKDNEDKVEKYFE